VEASGAADRTQTNHCMWNKPRGLALFLCLSLTFCASAQVQVRFDQARYVINPGDKFQVQVLIDPIPAAGLSSFGVVVTAPDTNAETLGLTSIVAATNLDFNGVRGAGAVKSVGNSVAAIKGTVNFDLSPAQPSRQAVIATVTLQDLGMGSYAIRLAGFNTLGPTEQLFVDGGGAVLDPQITYGSATVEYRAQQQPYAIFAGGASQPATNEVLFIKGKSNTITGSIHSNSGIKVGGSAHLFQNGIAEYVTDLSPTTNFQGKVAFVNSTLARSTNKPYPVAFNRSDYAPGGPVALAAQAAGKYYYFQSPRTNLNYYIQNGVLREGLYYVEGGEVTLTNASVRQARVTIVATDEILIHLNNALVESYINCLLAFTTEPDSPGAAITLAGTNTHWQGTVFAPAGLVELTGKERANEWTIPYDNDDADEPNVPWQTQNSTLLGSLIGQRVRVSGKNLQIIGTSPDACQRFTSILQPMLRFGQVELCFPTVSGLSYAIEYSDSLKPLNWLVWCTIPGNGGVVTLKPPVTGLPQRFYRFRLL
jgi:hypothetical protein